MRVPLANTTASGIRDAWCVRRSSAAVQRAARAVDIRVGHVVAGAVMSHGPG